MEGFMSIFSNIACCLNVSENSDDVAQYAKDLAIQNGAKLILIYVGNYSGSDYKILDQSNLGDLIEEQERSRQEALEKYVRDNFKGIETTVVMTEGDPNKELLEVIDKYCADLAVIGSVASRNLFGFIKQMTAKSLIERTRIPVMIIPSDFSLECVPDPD